MQEFAPLINVGFRVAALLVAVDAILERGLIGGCVVYELEDEWSSRDNARSSR